MIAAAFIVSLVAAIASFAIGHRMGVKRARFDARFQIERANGQFTACDAELNALKVKHSQALMQLEDKR